MSRTYNVQRNCNYQNPRSTPQHIMRHPIKYDMHKPISLLMKYHTAKAAKRCTWNIMIIQENPDLSAATDLTFP